MSNQSINKSRHYSLTVTKEKCTIGNNVTTLQYSEAKISQRDRATIAEKFLLSTFVVYGHVIYPTSKIIRQSIATSHLRTNRLRRITLSRLGIHNNPKTTVSLFGHHRHCIDKSCGIDAKYGRQSVEREKVNDRRRTGKQKQIEVSSLMNGRSV